MTILPSQWVEGRVKPREEMVMVGNEKLCSFTVHSKGDQVHEEK